MPDPTLSDALEEAYASAPAARAIIHTLSIYYAGMLNDAGAPAEVYVFSGWSGDSSDATTGVPLKAFTLESGARFVGGTSVQFIGLPFDVIMPSVAHQGIAKGQLVLDGIDRSVTALLKAAVAAGKPIEITYRAYLEGLETSGPQNDPPLVFGLQNVSATVSQVKGEIVVPNLSTKRFPRQLYLPETFPALRT